MANTILETISKNHDVIKDYRWTLTNTEKGTSDSYDEVPFIDIQEYEVDETAIATQWNNFTSLFTDRVATASDALNPYKDLFNKNAPKSKYRFPYFSDTNYELNSAPWASLDPLEQVNKFAEGTVGLFTGQTGADVYNAITKAGGTAAVATLGALYPKIGIMDRPKLWQSHDFRTITVKFPLFNVVAEADWKKNKNLIRQIINNSLFTKRDVITGFPPVFYDIKIPGVHYSYAASLNNIVINNRGNIHRLIDSTSSDGQGVNLVPDAYEVNLTFVDLVMPSRNLYKEMKEVSVSVEF